MHESLAVRAAALLPRDARFYVATGGGTGSVASGPFYTYWLLPRRAVPEAVSADWIVDYGADPSQLPVKTKVVEDLGGGALVLKVVR